MCRITITLLRSKPTQSFSQNTEAPRPTRRNKTMDSKTATLPSGVYLSPASAILSRSPTPKRNPAPNTDFVDHYAVMGLDNWATSEEIKAVYRRLRGEYFGSNNVIKYRALQAAFDVLADREARWTYDKMWRARKGLPTPPPLKTQKAGGHVNLSVAERVGVFERRDSKEVVCPAPAPAPVEVEMEVEVKEAEAEAVTVVRTPLIGTRPYHSYIPILAVYDGHDVHPTLKCGRPKYVMDVAKNAGP